MNILERLLALVLFLILLPLSIIICILIIIESNGNPIFVQDRIGKKGKHYKMYKFRTMQVHKAKGFTCVYNSDKRITKFGKILRKTRIDELPQLLNIIKGEMSFVGVRPDIDSHFIYYNNIQKKDYIKYN